MEDDGFTLVTGKKSAKNRTFKKTENGTHIRIDGSSEDVEKAMTSAKSGISSLAKWLTEKIENIAENRKIHRIYIIGNGHFDRPDEPGAHQLALFLKLAENFENAEIIFQEPVCSKAEIQWLKEQNSENFRLKIRESIDTNIEIEENTGFLTILGIIHGEHEILNEILTKNWTILENSRNLVVIGNDYGGVDWELSKFSAKNPEINEFYEKSIITRFPAVYEPHNSAFSGTVIMNEEFY